MRSQRRRLVRPRQLAGGILWRTRDDARTGAIPHEFGPWQTCHDRFRRWQRDGTWARILSVLQARQASSIDRACLLIGAERKGDRETRLRRGPRGPPAFDPVAYRLRTALERLVNRLEEALAVKNGFRMDPS